MLINSWVEMGPKATCQTHLRFRNFENAVFNKFRTKVMDDMVVFDNTDFYCSNLENAVFNLVSLWGANFWGANLLNTNFSHADLTRAHFKEALNITSEQLCKACRLRDIHIEIERELRSMCPDLFIDGQLEPSTPK